MNRATYQRYLLSKGLTPTQVGGILLNVEDESGFSPNPPGPNDQGNSYGLFQHNGPRKRALFDFAGTSNPSWQQQIDFALTEPDMRRYLSKDYGNYGEAGVAFLDDFERPAKHHRDTRAQKYLSRHSNDVAPDGYAGATISMGDVGGSEAYAGQSIEPVSYAQGYGVQAEAPQGNPMMQQGNPMMQQPPQRSLADNFAPNPWLQMGLGIMGSGNFAAGAQQGLAQAGQAQRAQQLGDLQMLRADNELYRLEEDRQSRKLKAQQGAVQRRARTALAEKYLDPTNPEYNPELGLAIQSEMVTDQGMTNLVLPGEESGADYGKTAQIWQRGVSEDGTPLYSSIQYGSDGKLNQIDHDKGWEPKGGPGFEGQVAGAKETEKLAAVKLDALNTSNSEALTQVNQSLSSAQNLLGRLEAGEFSGTGPLAGRAQEFLGDEDAAVLQAKGVGQALLNLQITNLAPVTENELALIQKLYANVNRTPQQNQAILREIVKARTVQREALMQVRSLLIAGTPPNKIQQAMAEIYGPENMPSIDMSAGDSPQQPTKPPPPGFTEVVQ